MADVRSQQAVVAVAAVTVAVRSAGVNWRVTRWPQYGSNRTAGLLIRSLVPDVRLVRRSPISQVRVHRLFSECDRVPRRRTSL